MPGLHSSRECVVWFQDQTSSNSKRQCWVSAYHMGEHYPRLSGFLHRVLASRAGDRAWILLSLQHLLVPHNKTRQETITAATAPPAVLHRTVHKQTHSLPCCFRKPNLSVLCFKLSNYLQAEISSNWASNEVLLCSWHNCSPFISRIFEISLVFYRLSFLQRASCTQHDKMREAKKKKERTIQYKIAQSIPKS